MKICKKCGELKSIDDFYKHFSKCKECVIRRVKKRYDSVEGKKKIKKYEYKRVRNPLRKEKHKIYQAKYRKKNIEEIREKHKLYKEKCKKLGIGEFSILGKKRSAELISQRYYRRYKKDILYTLAINLRSRINIAIKSNQKVGSAVEDLGCSIKELKIYLENKFLAGMTWNNWGSWHIDHIKPLSKFNLSDRKQYLEAINFINLQPLWAIDNLKKGAKYDYKYNNRIIYIREKYE